MTVESKMKVKGGAPAASEPNGYGLMVCDGWLGERMMAKVVSMMMAGLLRGL